MDANRLQIQAALAGIASTVRTSGVEKQANLAVNLAAKLSAKLAEMVKAVKRSKPYQLTTQLPQSTAEFTRGFLGEKSKDFKSQFMKDPELRKAYGKDNGLLSGKSHTNGENLAEYLKLKTKNKVTLPDNGLFKRKGPQSTTDPQNDISDTVRRSAPNKLVDWVGLPGLQSYLGYRTTDNLQGTLPDNIKDKTTAKAVRTANNLSGAAMGYLAGSPLGAFLPKSLLNRYHGAVTGSVVGDLAEQVSGNKNLGTIGAYAGLLGRPVANTVAPKGIDKLVRETTSSNKADSFSWLDALSLRHRLYDKLSLPDYKQLPEAFKYPTYTYSNQAIKNQHGYVSPGYRNDPGFFTDASAVKLPYGIGYGAAVSPSLLALSNKLQEKKSSYTAETEKQANIANFGKALYHGGNAAWQIGKGLYSGGKAVAGLAGPKGIAGKALGKYYRPAAYGYGGYQAQQALATTMGQHANSSEGTSQLGYLDRVSTPNTASWRKANRTNYTVNEAGDLVGKTNELKYLRDLLWTPGRTLAETAGFGGEGATHYLPQKPPKGSDLISENLNPVTGNYTTVFQNPQGETSRLSQTPIYRPDIQKRRQVVTAMQRKLQDLMGNQWSAGLSLTPDLLGYNAAMRSPESYSPVSRDYSLYNNNM